MANINEVQTFLDNLVGVSVAKPDGGFLGECVSLVTQVLALIGVPDPNKARGNAIDVGNAYLNEGIADNGRGQLSVCINQGNSIYGHVWLDIANVANYEQNGAAVGRVTKNTRPISQAAQIVNLDKWLETSSKKGKRTMEFLFNITDADGISFVGNSLYYFNGQKIILLTNGDQASMLQTIYRLNNGTDIPQRAVSTGYAVRLMQAIGQTKIEKAQS